MEFVNQKKGLHPYQKQTGVKSPSVFFITVDMIPPECYAATSLYFEHLRIPNLRSLFQDGVEFTNAFTTSPLCGPSRAAYLTGRYSYITVNEERAHDGQAIVLREEDIIFPEYLKAIGYKVRHVGKSHVGANVFVRAFGENDSPWNRWAPPIRDDDGYLAYLDRLSVLPMEYKKEIRGLRPDRKSPGNCYGGWVQQSNGNPFPVAATYPHYLADRAVETLRSSLSKEIHKKPVYLQLDFFAPHQPFMIPDGFQERYKKLASVVKVPQSFRDLAEHDFSAPWEEPKIYRTYRKNWGIYEESVAKDYMVCNLLQMEVLDAAIGKFIDELKIMGIYEESLIIFAGDHGEMNMELALLDKGVYGHPKIARTPIFVKLPNNECGGEKIASVVSLLDIVPTVLDAAGIEAMARLDGQSLLPLIKGESAKRENPILFETHWHVAPNPAVALIWEITPQKRYMYTYNLVSDIDEFYDLNDPMYRNLIHDKSVEKDKQIVLKEFSRVLSEDPRWVCYWHTFRLDHAEFCQEGGDAQMFSMNE